MSGRTLAEWLAYQWTLHQLSIDLGLDRVREVASRLDLLPASCLTLTVAGTNGKGSSATLAAGIYRAAGYRCGLYTSPHLLRYNERIAIDGIEVDDDSLCEAFEAVELARDDTPLTYFEFGTLAALWLFRRAGVEFQVLEVGLGGRLDAVNLVDADCALVTSIGIDHTDWLGPDRESIGYEKAGILRAGRPAVCADPEPPSRLVEYARVIGAPLRLLGRDFHAQVHPDGNWDWDDSARRLAMLPAPGLFGVTQYRNAAGVLAAVDALQPRIPVAESAVRAALPALRLRGRFERRGNIIYDVAHNAEAIGVLLQNLAADQQGQGRLWLIFGMLADKPVEVACAMLAEAVAGAYFVTLPAPRGLSAEELRVRAASAGLNGVAVSSVNEALRRALADAGPLDRILVCGSFLTVAAALQSTENR